MGDAWRASRRRNRGQLRRARMRAVRWAHRHGTSRDRREMFLPRGYGSVCTGEGDGYVAHVTGPDGSWLVEWFTPRADVGRALRARLVRQEARS